MDRIGRYKIVRELGRGAMGVVYHAIDPNIGRPVAIKTIQFGNHKPEELERMKERLFREARSAGILSHPGIVTIYDVDQQGDLAYIAMEYVDGPTLDQMLSGTAAIGPERMFSILGQTGVALDYAHSKGIVHRDIKPANLMVTADGTTKITDFGIAKLATSDQLTRTGAIVGTPHYMSPEQVQGQAVDGRSDQFSLAVIAYEMLTGEKPYTGEHLTTVVYKIVAEEPAPPRRINPSLSPAIDAALRKALAKRPDDRYRSCQEFATALEAACAASAGWKMLPRAGLLNEPTVAEVAASGSRATLPPPRRRARAATATAASTTQRKSGFLPFLLGILVVAGLLALIGWQAMPWLMPQYTQQAESHEAPAPAPAPHAEAPATAQPAGPPAPGYEKPSALGASPDTAPKPEPPEEPDSPPKREHKTVVTSAPSGEPQEVLAITSPAGATARLDGDASSSCATPCRLTATPGRHRVTFSLPGHLMEVREILVGSGPLEMAPVSLRAAVGTLYLSSAPDGAAITINGKRLPQLTPANLQLAPGTYNITVERDGRQVTGQVEVREGMTTYRRVVLNP